MGKLEYLDALKRAMLGLPPDIQAKTLAYYEQRFVDAAGAGRSERDVASELDAPTKIAMTLRASSHLQAISGALTEKKDPANFLRLTVSAVGLAIFNLFMIVPALVYAALLFTLYACALSFYLAGIACSASGLAGTNELVLDWPARFMPVDADSRGERQTRITIGAGDIQVTQERPGGASSSQDDLRSESRSGSRVLRGAEAVADSSLRISTEMDAESRTTQTLVGAGMVVGGIGLFLVSLVVTRYTGVALKRYLQMNRSLLKGH
jgi:uncharacterized membrane protein